MNWLLIAVILVFAWNLVLGFSRGFLRVAYSLVAWLLILAFVTVVTPYVADFLTAYTSFDERVEEACAGKLHELVPSDGADARASLPGKLLDRLWDVEDMAERAASFAVKSVTYVLVFLLTFIVFHLLAFSLDLVSRLPLIGGVNHLLGLLAGAVKGLLLIWIAFAFIAMTGATGFIAFIRESELLEWFYENNLVLQILLIFL